MHKVLSGEVHVELFPYPQLRPPRYEQRRWLHSWLLLPVPAARFHCSVTLTGRNLSDSQEAILFYVLSFCKVSADAIIIEKSMSVDVVGEGGRCYYNSKGSDSPFGNFKSLLQILSFLSQNALETFRYNIIVYVHPYSLLKLITKPLDIASLVRGIPTGSIEWPLIVFPAPFAKGTLKKKKRPTHINLYTHTHTLTSKAWNL